MASRLLIRRRLFKHYAANFGIHFPEHAGRCACPICGAVYDESSVEYDALGMDVAHVYPEACGGNLETLTCKPCNSRIGAKYESHVAKDYKIIDALGGSGRGSLNVRVHFDGGSMGAEVCRTGNHFQFRTVKEQTDPKVLKAGHANIAKGGQVQFSMEFVPPDPTRYSVAMLHSAYLSAFRYFGYEYCKYADTQWIRDLLRRDDPPDEVHYLSSDPDEENVPPAALFTPAVAAIDGQECAIAVPLPLPLPTKRHRLVFLPGLGLEAAAAYKRVQEEWVERRHRFRIGWDFGSAPATRLGDPSAADFGRAWWWHLSRRLLQKDGGTSEN